MVVVLFAHRGRVLPVYVAPARLASATRRRALVAAAARPASPGRAVPRVARVEAPARRAPLGRRAARPAETAVARVKRAVPARCAARRCYATPGSAGARPTVPPLRAG